MYNKHLIVGFGEVGKAVNEVLGGMCSYIDTHRASVEGDAYRYLHICIPYTHDFNKTVAFYQATYPKALVVVHSTVPVGVCDYLGVVHSPVTGVHPYLEEGIRTFVKYFGGKGAKRAARVFSKQGVKSKVFKEARTTEAMKLWSTTQYGRLIMLEKEIYKWCKENKLDFKDVYTRSNKDYNTGYKKLDMEHVVRPVLKHVEGEIGGHCVRQNAVLLKVKL